MAVKNQAITVSFSVVDVSTGFGKTGDAANLSVYLILDNTCVAATNAPAEIDSTHAQGSYRIALTASEMNHDYVCVVGKSSTANVQVIPRQIPIDPFTPDAAEGLSNIGTGYKNYGTLAADIFSISGDENAAQNMSVAFAPNESIYLGKNESGISFAGDFKSGERVPAIFAQFTKGGAPIPLDDPPSVTAVFYSYAISPENPLQANGSDQIEVIHSFANEGVYDENLTSYYTFGSLSGSKLIDGVHVPVFDGRRGRILIRFHTDQSDVDQKDVYREIGVNTGSFVQEMVDTQLAEINAKTKTLGQMSVIIQSPNLTGDSFKIVSGDSYPRLASGSAIVRPIRIQVAGVPFSLSSLSIAFYLKYKNTSGQTLVTKVTDIAVSNLTEISFYLEVGLTDEQTRLMAAQTDGQWEIKVFEADGVNNWRDATLASGMFTVTSPIYDGATGPTPA